MAKSPRRSAAAIARHRREICEIGRRMDTRGFVAGHDGNISCRIGADRVLCTPTLISKGRMRPADLCVVDMDGVQVSGRRPRSSEILLHLAIFRARTDVGAVVHCHPPHATAYAVAREPIPRGVLPEVELFLGDVPLAPYATPGSRAVADAVTPLVTEANAVLLANHGTVTCGPSLERAYWRTEILDASCRIFLLARGLGRLATLSATELAELEALGRQWAAADPPAPR